MIPSILQSSYPDTLQQSRDAYKRFGRVEVVAARNPTVESRLMIHIQLGTLPFGRRIGELVGESSRDLVPSDRKASSVSHVSATRHAAYYIARDPDIRSLA